MNKVNKLIKEQQEVIRKTNEKIKKIQGLCKHKTVEKSYAYDGITKQCMVCNKYLR